MVAYHHGSQQLRFSIYNRGQKKAKLSKKSNKFKKFLLAIFKYRPLKTSGKICFFCRFIKKLQNDLRQKKGKGFQAVFFKKNFAFLIHFRALNGKKKNNSRQISWQSCERDFNSLTITVDLMELRCFKLYPYTGCPDQIRRLANVVLLKNYPLFRHTFLIS